MSFNTTKALRDHIWAYQVSTGEPSRFPMLMRLQLQLFRFLPIPLSLYADPVIVILQSVSSSSKPSISFLTFIAWIDIYYIYYSHACRKRIEKQSDWQVRAQRHPLRMGTFARQFACLDWMWCLWTRALAYRCSIYLRSLSMRPRRCGWAGKQVSNAHICEY